jgi:hypothetical protein
MYGCANGCVSGCVGVLVEVWGGRASEYKRMYKVMVRGRYVLAVYEHVCTSVLLRV